MLRSENSEQSKESKTDEPIVGSRFQRKELLHVTESSRVYASKLFRSFSNSVRKGVNIKTSQPVILKIVKFLNYRTSIIIA